MCIRDRTIFIPTLLFMSCIGFVVLMLGIVNAVHKAQQLVLSPDYDANSFAPDPIVGSLPPVVSRSDRCLMFAVNSTVSISNSAIAAILALVIAKLFALA